jgi:hypothetical protein
MPKPSGLDAMLVAASLPEKTVELCLRGDLVARIEDLERDLRTALTNQHTMADRAKSRKVAEQIEAVRTEMHDSAVVFRFRGLNRRAWVDLLAEHEPRKDNAEDAEWGYNTDTFFPALLRACLIDPEVDEEQWERLESVMTAKQFDELVDVALTVSRRSVDIPFSFASVVAIQNFDGNSKPQSA